MAFLIDGHNLIPKMAGLSLRDIDDEQQLIEILQNYCRLRRRSVEVFFDNAPPGYSRKQCSGSVTAHFIRQGMTADSAITHRLKTLERAARNCTVVSSDRRVQLEARAAGAQVLSSDAFAEQIQQILQEDTVNGEDPSRMDSPSESDLQEWMRLFGINDGDQ